MADVLVTGRNLSRRTRNKRIELGISRSDKSLKAINPTINRREVGVDGAEFGVDRRERGIPRALVGSRSRTTRESTLLDNRRLEK